MLQDNTELAAKYLREAIPLMVKHSIPPTPFNYALWYNYVSNRDPLLNQAIENALATYGTCTPEITEQLFVDHIIDEQVGSAKQLEHSIKAIAEELQEQMDVAMKGTEHFQRLLKASNENLNNSDTLEQDLPEILSELMDGTEQVTKSTENFRQQVADARSEVEQLKKELRRSQKEAQSDALTGLYNRRYLDPYLESLVASDQAKDYFLVLTDIDHFKSFNDTYGHLVGDQVIKRVSNLLQKALVVDEIGVRYGGEEFLLVLKKASFENIAERVEKIRKMVETIVLKDRKQGKSIKRITASFGIAQHNPAESITAWLERADQALYQAKENGRNQVIMAD